MSPRYVRGLIASLLLHVVLVGAVLVALPRSEVLPALFIDLTTVSGDAASVEPRERMRADAPRASTRAPRPAPRPEPAAPPRSSDGPTVREPSPPAPTYEPPPPASEPEPPAPAVAPPSPTLAPAPPPAAPDDATVTSSVPVPPAEEPSTASAALPSASAKLNGGDGGGVRGGDTPGDSATRDEVERGRSDSPSKTGGVGAGQDIARRSPGSESGETPAVYKEYLSRLRQRVHEALRYPPAARRWGLTGAVTIELTILPSGLIRDVSVAESSSHPILDEAALETVRTLRSQPFPRHVPPRTLRVRLPVVFELQ